MSVHKVQPGDRDYRLTTAPTSSLSPLLCLFSTFFLFYACFTSGFFRAPRPLSEHPSPAAPFPDAVLPLLRCARLRVLRRRTVFLAHPRTHEAHDSNHARARHHTSPRARKKKKRRQKAKCYGDVLEHIDRPPRSVEGQKKHKHADRAVIFSSSPVLSGTLKLHAADTVSVHTHTRTHINTHMVGIYSSRCPQHHCRKCVRERRTRAWACVCTCATLLSSSCALFF